MVESVFSDLVLVLALALTCHRVWWHGTARLGTDSAEPGQVDQHGGTNRHDTYLLSCLDMSCRAVSGRASTSASAVPYGPVGYL
jgi:hypothetical protein